jgi:hypothetical protein
MKSARHDTTSAPRAWENNVSEKWKSRYVPITHQYIVTDADENVIAVIQAVPGTERDKQAARLIAAAPDLLNAVRILTGTEIPGGMADGEKAEVIREAVELAGTAL